MLANPLSDPRTRLALSHMRLAQTGEIFRRIMGRPVWKDEDYRPSLSEDDRRELPRIAEEIRGDAARAAVFVHGVLPRSGTNFVANALSLHPDICAFPDDIWEFPLLHLAPGGRALRNEILSLFPANDTRLSPLAPLAYVASGWLHSLELRYPRGRFLFKSPHVRGLSLFSSLFPHDHLVVCIRDGRDIAASSEGTFKGGIFGKNLTQIAHEWRQATDAVLDLENARPDGITVVRFEDLVRSAANEIRRILPRIDLDIERFPFDELEHLPVFGSSTNDRSDDERWQPVERSGDFSPIGRWKNWPERRKRRFHDLAGTALERAGYA
ncbi:MAG: sulfotransferase [Geminicoccaceae bacterium]|nr:sulfotransferase [Geminicoccaceae bacterium]